MPLGPSFHYRLVQFWKSRLLDLMMHWMTIEPLEGPRVNTSLQCPPGVHQQPPQEHNLNSFWPLESSQPYIYLGTVCEGSFLLLCPLAQVNFLFRVSWEALTISLLFHDIIFCQCRWSGAWCSSYPFPPISVEFCFAFLISVCEYQVFIVLRGLWKKDIICVLL